MEQEDIEYIEKVVRNWYASPWSKTDSGLTEKGDDLIKLLRQKKYEQVKETISAEANRKIEFMNEGGGHMMDKIDRGSISPQEVLDRLNPSLITRIKSGFSLFKR